MYFYLSQPYFHSGKKTKCGGTLTMVCGAPSTALSSISLIPNPRLSGTQKLSCYKILRGKFKWTPDTQAKIKWSSHWHRLNGNHSRVGSYKWTHTSSLLHVNCMQRSATPYTLIKLFTRFHCRSDLLSFHFQHWVETEKSPGHLGLYNLLDTSHSNQYILMPFLLDAVNEVKWSALRLGSIPVIPVIQYF